jgi:hypothetical protein
LLDPLVERVFANANGGSWSVVEADEPDLAHVLVRFRFRDLQPLGDVLGGQESGAHGGVAPGRTVCGASVSSPTGDTALAESSAFASSGNPR